MLRIASGDIIDVDTLLTNSPTGLARAGVPDAKIQASLKAIVQEVTGYILFMEKGAAPILKAWRDRAQIKGRRIKVHSFKETLIGVAMDIDSDGGLILETTEGRKKVVAGDIEYER